MKRSATFESVTRRAHRARALRRELDLTVDHFLDWLDLHRGLPGAETIIGRGTGADMSQLTGHVNEMFGAVSDWLLSEATLITVIAPAVNEMGADQRSIRYRNDVLSKWIEFLRSATPNASYSPETVSRICRQRWAANCKAEEGQ